MIIFHIPSWYPHPETPYAGIFIKDQIAAYSQLYAEDKCYVTNFHELRFKIPISSPIKAASNFIAFLKQKKLIELKVLPNFIELQTKVLVGNEKLFGNYYENQRIIAETHLLDVIKREKTKPDLLHAHVCYPGGLIAQYLSEKYQIPFVITEHSSIDILNIAFDEYQVKNQLLNMFAQAKGIWAQSTYHRNQLAQLVINNIDIIPNLVDENFFYPLKNKEQNKHFTFFTLGIMVERKGIKNLLNAIKEVSKKNQNAIFRIGGIGNELEQLKRYSNEIGISTHVQWLGKLTRAEIVNEFQTCDCFVLPSKSESFGVVYVEALACGKPIIATDCGGPADIVTSLNGLLIEKENVNALTNAIIAMIAEGSKYDAASIRADFINRFSKVKVIEEIKQFYIKAINSK